MIAARMSAGVVTMLAGLVAFVTAPLPSPPVWTVASLTAMVAGALLTGYAALDGLGVE